MELDWEPLDPAFKADPWPFYGALLEGEPLWQSPHGPLLVSRHEDCLALLRHPRASSDFRKHPGWSGPPTSGSEDEFVPTFLGLDPPDHTRLRGLVSRAFTPQRVEALRPRMEQIVERALDDVTARGGRMEVVGDLAFPLPVLVICELLGVPSEDAAQLKAWSSANVRLLDPSFTLDAPAFAAGVQSALAQREYFRRLVTERRADPRDDLTSALVALADAGELLRLAELVGTLQLLLIAGHETTVNLIANGVLELGRHPGELRRLRESPEMVRSAVEEVLRYAPPVHLDSRLPLEDIELPSGAVVPAYSDATLVLAAANRDPRVIEEPGTFDVGRPVNRHLGFGFGIHHCLGAPLARLEGQVALGAIARRFSRIEVVVDPPPYKEHVTIPGVSTLEVTLS